MTGELGPVQSTLDDKPAPTSALIKVLIGSLSGIMLGGAFSAGIVYQRLGSVELQLIGIHQEIVLLGQQVADQRSVADKTSDYERRIEKLEDQVRQLR